MNNKSKSLKSTNSTFANENLQDSPNKVDTTLKPQYFELNKYFRNDTTDSTLIKVLFFVLYDFIKSEDIDTTSSFYSDVDLIKKMENKDGVFFIVKLNCTAGGDCATFYMIEFNKAGKFERIAKLGDLTSEEDQSKYFDFKMASDTMLVTYQIEYDNNRDTAVDTIVTHIKLK